MKKRISDSLLPQYRAAIHSMREGNFGPKVQVDLSDEIGKLGQDLNGLAQELERKFSEAIKIREISEEITAGLFLEDVLNRAYDSFRPVIPYDRMGCALLSDENSMATAYWERTEASEILLKSGYSSAMFGSSLQLILETGQPRILNDLQTYLDEHPNSVSTKLLRAEGMYSNFTCPLIAQGKAVGFLFFTSMKKNTYQNIHKNIFLLIAGQISILIEKSRLYQQLYELNQKLLQAQHELQYKATHDTLTELYNRRAITEHLEAQLSRAKRLGLQLCIIMLDVDHFKLINDNHSHLAGDTVLKTVAARMSDCLREYDYIGRYGGEEFLVILGESEYEAAIVAAGRLNQAVGSKPIAFGDKLLTITVSAGVAVVKDCNIYNLDQILMAADQELYRAKSNGRNRVEVCRM
jgi:diguanylate cyclase (GGDEF)-like protein